MSECFFCDDQNPMIADRPGYHEVEADGIYGEALCHKIKDTFLHVRPIVYGHWSDKEDQVEFVLHDYTTHRSIKQLLPVKKFERAIYPATQLTVLVDYMRLKIRLSEE